jgi:hypothetical protein
VATFDLKVVPKISVLSTIFLRCVVSVTESGLPADPTNGDISFAFIEDGLNTNPETGDWKAGSWESSPDGTYYGKCLVGPAGTVTLDVGTYDVWVRVVRGSETVIEQAGTVTIY